MAVTAQTVCAELVCTRCAAVLPEEAFDRNARALHRNGRHQWCKTCRTASWRERYLRDPEAARESARWRTAKWRYGHTEADYFTLLEAQHGVCAICHKADERRLCVDHDHGCCPGQQSCGKCIRGLLCNSCNRLLGITHDDPDVLRAAIAYLEG